MCEGGPNPLMESYLKALSVITSTSQRVSCSSLTDSTPATSPAGCAHRQQQHLGSPPRSFNGLHSAPSMPESILSRHMHQQQQQQQQLIAQLQREHGTAAGSGMSLPMLSALARHDSTQLEVGARPLLTASSFDSSNSNGGSSGSRQLARNSNGCYVSPFAMSNAGACLLGSGGGREQQVGLKGTSSVLTQALKLKQLQPEASAPAAPAAGLTGAGAAAGLTSALEPNRRADCCLPSALGKSSHSVAIPGQALLGLNGCSPSSSDAARCDSIYGGSPPELPSSRTSTAKFWGPAVAASAPGGFLNDLAGATAAARAGRLLRPLGSVLSASSAGASTAALLCGTSSAPVHVLQQHQVRSRISSSAACLGQLSVRLPEQAPGVDVRRSMSALELHSLAGGVQGAGSPLTSFNAVERGLGSMPRSVFGRIAEAWEGPLDYTTLVADQFTPRRYTPEERAVRIARYKAKRDRRNFTHLVKYQCRKNLADSRPRVRGRFARDGEPGSVLPHQTKKTQKGRAGQQQQQGVVAAVAGAAPADGSNASAASTARAAGIIPAAGAAAGAVTGLVGNMPAAVVAAAAPAAGPWQLRGSGSASVESTPSLDQGITGNVLAAVAAAPAAAGCSTQQPG